MSLLVRTPHPQPTESLLGYVLRISEENGYSSAWHIFQLAGVQPDAMLSPQVPVEKLEAVLGMQSGTLSRYAYRSTDGDASFKLLGTSLGRSPKEHCLGLRSASFCPLCVQEKGFIDAFFDLSVVSVCPDHRCKLLETCPSCSAAVSWFRPGLLTCRCGASLANGSSTPATAEDAELQGALRAVLHGVPLSKCPNTCNFPIAQLEEIPLQPLMQLLLTLGQRHLMNQGVEEAHSSAAMAAASRVLLNWPAGYVEFLKETGVALNPEGLPGTGLRKHFAPLYESLFKGRPWSPHAEFLRKEFVVFGLKHWGHAAVDKKLLRGDEADDRRFISKRGFERQFGISYAATKRLIQEGVLSVEAVALGRRTCAVVDLDASQLPVAKESVITVREAAALAGLPVSVIVELRARGVLKTSIRAGHRTSWYRSDVTTFIAGAPAPASAKTKGKDGVSLGEVMRLKLGSVAAKADVVQAVWEGEIPVIGLVGESLSSLILDKRAVDEVVVHKRATSGAPYLPIATAAEATGLDWVAVDDAVKKGLLSAVLEEGRMLVDAASVAAFNERFVSLAKLAKRLQTNGRTLKSWCDDHSWELVEVSRGPGAPPQPLMKKSDEPALLVAWEKARNEAEVYSFEQRECAHLEALVSYLGLLKERREPLPMRAGQPNKAVIARACGFNRAVLYSSASAIKLLSEAG